ncbi:hypothetical protein E2542_SST03431 [Spatholobus suberectus]|nr:hypothetical protein E2542_SST03431 [Spatholobus suberectus]
MTSFRKRFLRGNHKYNEATRTLVVLKVGHWLVTTLGHVRVFVKTVQDKPRAAEWAPKRQMVHFISRGFDCLILVLDDSNFLKMLRRVREDNLGTVVVKDWDMALRHYANLWVPRIGVKNGEVDLVPNKRGKIRTQGIEDELF